MRSAVGIPHLPVQAVAKGQGGGGCQQNDKTEAEAGAMLQAIIDAFPNAGWRRLCPHFCGPQPSDNTRK